MAHMPRRLRAPLLKEREARLSARRAGLIEGERSGEPELFDFDDFLEDKRNAANFGRHLR